MIRPASEIEYPPSEALCTKARMIRRLEAMGKSTSGLMSVIAERLTAEDAGHLAEIEMLSQEQDRLIANMKRLVRS